MVGRLAYSQGTGANRHTRDVAFPRLIFLRNGSFQRVWFFWETIYFSEIDFSENFSRHRLLVAWVYERRATKKSNYLGKYHRYAFGILGIISSLECPLSVLALLLAQFHSGASNDKRWWEKPPSWEVLFFRYFSQEFPRFSKSMTSVVSPIELDSQIFSPCLWRRWWARCKIPRMIGPAAS